MGRTTMPPPEPELGTLAPLRNTRLRQLGSWLGQETLWSVDVFARMFATIVVLRTVSSLVTTWWFPKNIWDASPSLVRGFGGDSEELREGDPDDDEEFVFASEGYQFYRHARRHQGQRWACPLLFREPCDGCPWFVEAVDGPRCAAVLKLALRNHERYRHYTLEDLRTMLEERHAGVFG